MFFHTPITYLFEKSHLAPSKAGQALLSPGDTFPVPQRPSPGAPRSPLTISLPFVHTQTEKKMKEDTGGDLFYSDRDDFIEGKYYSVLRDRYKIGVKGEPVWPVLAGRHGVKQLVCCS